MKLSDVDIFNPDNFVRGQHHEMFKVLRHEAPVFWQNEPKGRGFWAVTKYADVAAVSKQHGKFSSAKGAVFIMDPPQGDLEQMQMMMLNMDPPRHTKLRRVISEGFTPRRIALIEPHIREMADTIIDRIAGQGECDFVADVAAELPLLVIAELVGIPLGDRQMVFNWSNQLVGFDDPEYSVDMMETGRAAAAEMYMYANQLALERKENPRDDLTSILMHSEVDGEKLSELEFDLFFLLLAVAGNETTRNAISGGLLALIEHPEERARLAANPALMPTAIEEILRWVSPVMHFRRTAMCDTEIGGVKIREGDKVVIYYLSANRDEDVFPDPYRFDVGRTPNEHLAFGLGQHFCLGNNLAKLELRMIFEALLQRLPDIDLAGPVERLRSNFINGIKRMPVRFTPRRERISA